VFKHVQSRQRSTDTEMNNCFFS